MNKLMKCPSCKDAMLFSPLEKGVMQGYACENNSCDTKILENSAETEVHFAQNDRFYYRGFIVEIDEPQRFETIVRTKSGQEMAVKNKDLVHLERFNLPAVNFKEKELQ